MVDDSSNKRPREAPTGPRRPYQRPALTAHGFESVVQSGTAGRPEGASGMAHMANLSPFSRRSS